MPNDDDTLLTCELNHTAEKLKILGNNFFHFLLLQCAHIFSIISTVAPS